MLTTFQRWLLWLSLAIFLFGAFGKIWQDIWTFLFGEQAEIWRFVMRAAMDAEDWVRNRGGSVVLMGLALLIALGTLQLPTLWRVFRRHRINRDEFRLEFENAAHSRTRIFTAAIAFARQKYRKSLPQLLDHVTIPKELPLETPANIYEWVKTNSFTVDQEEILKLVGEIHKKGMNESSGEFLTDRLAASKFWDEFGRRIQEGVLDVKDVIALILPSYLDIKFLTFLELAIIRDREIGRGHGKRGLFYMAHLVEEKNS